MKKKQWIIIAIIAALAILISIAVGITCFNPAKESETDSAASSQSDSVSLSGDKKNLSESTSVSNSGSLLSASQSSSSSGSDSGHTHDFTKTVVAPTCSEEGYTLKECECGYSEKTDHTDTVGHKYGEWITFIEPTTQTKGYKERFCEYCGAKEHVDLPKLSEASSSSQASSSADSSQEADNWYEEVLRLVNIEREKAGLSPLYYAWGAQSAADIRAQEIQSSFSHTRPNGTDCFTALKEAGVSFNTAGENIAYGYGSPAQVVDGWMNSQPHRENILSSNFSGLAVGINGTYWVQLFIG